MSPEPKERKTPVNAGDEPIVRLEKIEKYFGRLAANEAVDLSIYSGRIKALLGENGAGKSTLMNILAGRMQPDGGTIRVDGRAVAIGSAHTAHRLGIGMVYQHFTLVERMSVAQNVMLGQPDFPWRYHKARMEKRVKDLSERYGLVIDPAATVAGLSMGERQRVEILKLLQRDCRVLIFDEPTAVLTPGEADQLFQAFKRMTDQGRAVVFISHKLDEVTTVADEISVLRKGRVVAEIGIGQRAATSDLARKMVGREVVFRIEREPAALRQVVLRIDDLNGAGLKDIRLQIRQGEILGLVGVAGNGQKTLVEAICGLRPAGTGEVTVLGRSLADFYADHAWDGNLAHIPEDRRGLAACVGMTLTENFLLTTRNGFTRGPWLRWRSARAKTRELIASFDVQPADSETLARRLSGGNLQKLVLAREFFRRPRLIMAEQPTQGLDVGATEEIWQVLLKARERAGILLVTGDLNEALALSDRIAVIFNGRIVADFDAGDRAMVERIGLFMAGVAG
jgi:simple sugar transport system ATP-binding protein